MTAISPRILVVDDSALAAQRYRSYLETDPDLSYIVQLVESGDQALALCRESAPDLVLIDYTLPQMDGLAFLEQLRAFAPPTQIPVVVITPLDSADLAVQVMKSGAQDCLLEGKLTAGAVRRSVRTTLDYRNLQLRLQRQQDLQNLLSSLTLQIRQFLTLDEILNTLVVLLRQCLKADRVLVCHADGHCLTRSPALTVSATEEQTVTPGVQVLESLPCSLLSQLAQHRSPGYPQVYTLPAAATDALEKSGGVQSQLAVPIAVQQQTAVADPASNAAPGTLSENLWGWIVVEQCTYARSWHPWEVQLLEQLAAQVAIAINQAELYNRLQNWNAKLETRVTERTKALRLVERELRHLNRDLELRVADRTQALQVANQRFEQLVAHINEVFWIVNLEPLQVIYVSPGYRQIWGREEQELYQYPQQLLETVHPADQMQVKRLCQTALEAAHLIFECRILRPDREVRWVQVEGVAVQDEQGVPHRLVGRAGDITERKQSQSEIIRQRDLREAIFNEANDALLLVEPHHFKIVDCNQRALTLFDARTKQQLIHRSFPHLSRESLSPRQLASLTEQLRSQGSWYGELEFRTCQALDFWGNVAAKSVQSTDTPLYLVRITDVTSQKEAESRVYRALKESEELSKLKSRFIAMTSHEFRTPLAVIASSVGILQCFGDRLSPEQRDQHLATIQTYVQHTTRLLDDVLLLNQAESEKLSYEPAPLKIVAFCQEICREMGASYPDFEIQLTVASDAIAAQFSPEAAPAIDPAQAPAAPDIEYILDEKLLRQILTNLLSNALKYSAPTSPIQVTLTLGTNTVQLQIQDQGIGIPAQDLPQLFQAFHRASNVGTIQGTGLGLSIVKHCLDLHQGSIAVESREGEGTCFTVTLPASTGQR